MTKSRLSTFWMPKPRVLFGVVERVSALPAISVLPVALFEFSLGVYLTIKGFKPSPITADMV